MIKQIQFPKIVRLASTPYAFLLSALLIILSYYFADRPVANYLQTLYGTSVYQFAHCISLFGYALYPVILLICGILIGYFVIKKRSWVKASWFLLGSLAIPGLLCDVLKIIFGRARPHEWFRHGNFGFYFFQTNSHFWSFPSDHTSVMTGLMMGCCFIWPRRWMIFIFLAVLVGCSRLVVTMHFLSDVLAGMYPGVIAPIWLNQKTKAYPLGKATTSSD